MDFGRFSLNNKYLMLALTIAILLLGVYSKLVIKTQLSPDTDSPMATVIIAYPGASAEDTAKDIIEPMENEFGKLEGISKISATGQDSRAIIKLQFEYGINIDEASIDIQNSINSIRGRLPSNMSEPKILKISSSDKPILTIALNSETMDMNMIREIAEEKLSYTLQSTPGVSSVEIFGGYKTEVHVLMDKHLMESYKLSLNDVSTTINLDNISAPGGSVEYLGKDILIRIEEDYDALEALRNVLIPTKDGNHIRLSEISNITMTHQKLDSTYKERGSMSISLMVLKKKDANTVDTIERVKEKIKDLEKSYPALIFSIAQDDSTFTNQMVSNMIASVVIAILLTVIIIVLFISKLSEALVVATSMPLVFMTTLGFMNLLGMKLDMVTLSALILSIGIVVDDSIVIVENVLRHIDELEKDIVTATIDATREISLSTIAGTSTTLIVLVPLLFIEGFVGQMFGPLSTTLIIALLASVIESLTIIPLFIVMFSKIDLTKIEKKTNIITSRFQKLMDKVLDFYVRLLEKALKHRLKTIAIAVLLMIAGASGLYFKGIEMLPKFDSGISYVSIEMLPGTKLEKTVEAVTYVEKWLLQENNVLSFDTQIGFEPDSNLLSDFGVMGTNQALITVNLNTRKERKETIWTFQERLRKEITKLPEIQRFVVKEQGAIASSSSTAPLDIRISGPDQEVLMYLANQFQGKVERIKGTTNIYKSFYFNDKLLKLNLDNEKLSDLNISTSYVITQIYQNSEGIYSTKIDLPGIDNVNILVAYQEEFRTSIENLLDYPINIAEGVTIPLREIAEIEVHERSNVVTKEDLEYTIDIYGYTHNRAFSKIIADIEYEIERFPLPQGYSMQITGDLEALNDSMKDMIFLLSLSIVFVYLLLVPQFKSFIHPITIMAAIPLVLVGVAPALIISGKYISMPVVLGFILLAGTVVNNSILLLDKTIALRNDGESINDSVIAAVKSRYRAIMMTALSDVAGMLPLAMQLALGSERFSPLAVTVIGGIISATFMTMIIIPVIYTIFEDLIVLKAKAA